MIAVRAPKHAAIDRNDTVVLALLVLMPVIVLDQFLHTQPAAMAGSWGYELMYCASDVLFGLPLAVAAVWAGNRIADRWEFGRGAWDVFARAGLIALALAVVLIPGWFLHDEADALAHATAVVSADSHGHDEVHWAGDAVFRGLILVPLLSAAVWGGDRVGRRLLPGKGGGSRLMVRLAVIGVLVGLALISAWYLEQGADLADTGSVTYTSAAFSGHHAHAFVPQAPGRFTRAHLALLSPAPASTTTLGSLLYDVAHALRDGLAGQAVGLPVMFVVLLWLTWRRPPARYPAG